MRLEGDFANRDANTNLHGYADDHGDGNCDPDCYSYGDLNGHTHGHINFDLDTFPDGIRYPDFFCVSNTHLY